MKIVLKEFQESAVDDLFRFARQARLAAAEGDAQALILAAPTGSGKTVVANALFERILEGDGINEGDSTATFLWLTDQPELNEQTRRKFATNTSVFTESQLITIDAATFDEPRFAPGSVYFLNTQKIGRGKQLTLPGDKRENTIWETITRTVEESGGSFWLIIDEAHRGMQNADPEFATAIVQKFIVGSGEIPAVPLVLGISATPQRFQVLLAGTTRHQRPLEIKPEAVRESGLIKDWITVYHPVEKQPSDWTLLRAAADKLIAFENSWKTYSEAEGEPPVEPLLLIQVEDAPASGGISRTSISDAIRELEDVLGFLEDHEIGHSLQEGGELALDNRSVQYVAPPDIQDRPGLRVVFFKMALNTGWDCPRAEVMMSFRRAVDYTNIAQLVGRTVRTPLARRITIDETLNSVALYLPHFDTKSLDNVIGYLESPDPAVGLPTTVKRGEFAVEITRDKKLGAAVFDFAETLPTYVVERISKTSDVRRLVRLARYLTQDKLDDKAYERQRKYVVSLLEKERNRLKNTKAFKSAVVEAGKVMVRAVDVAYASSGAHDGDPNGSTTTELNVAEQNVDDLYESAGRQLGEGLQADYAKARVAAEPSITLTQAKVELYALLNDPKTLPNLEQACGARFTKLYTKHQNAVNELSDGRRQAYRKLLKMAKQPQATTMRLPQRMLADSRDDMWKKHLFVDDGREYPVKLNAWESDVLKSALREKDVAGWLRNEPRQEWSFCVPYKHHADDRPHYPDFLVFRKSGDGHVADVLEPHSLSFDDGWAKARGLAEFAKQHGDLFGRIELIAKVKSKMRRLDLKDTKTRDKVLVANNNEQLVHLFENV